MWEGLGGANCNPRRHWEWIMDHPLIVVTMTTSAIWCSWCFLAWWLSCFKIILRVKLRTWHLASSLPRGSLQPSSSQDSKTSAPHRLWSTSPHPVNSQRHWHSTSHLPGVLISYLLVLIDPKVMTSNTKPRQVNECGSRESWVFGEQENVFQVQRYSDTIK